jgi:hypothetical protein
MFSQCTADVRRAEARAGASLKRPAAPSKRSLPKMSSADFGTGLLASRRKARNTVSIFLSTAVETFLLRFKTRL